MSDIIKLRKHRAYVEGSITSTLNQLEGLCDPKAAAAVAKPSETLVFTFISDVEERLKTVDEFTSEICFELDELMQEEVENNSKYVLSVKTQICMYRDSFPKKGSQNANVENCKTVKLSLPPITLESFENNSSHPFAYFTFKKTFLNALAGIPNLTNAQKLIYLKNFVKGEALSTVEHVTVNDDGFKTAFDLLDFNFLNKEEIRDRTIDTILSLSEAKSLKEVETLIRAVNSKLHELKSLNLDLLVSNKLPRHFLIELFRETGTNYPSFNLLLQVNIKDNSSKGQDNQVNISSSNKGAKPKMVNKSSNEKPTSDKKSSEAKVKSSKCRFCGSPEHTTVSCEVHPSIDARIKLADQKGWCTKCLSGKHNTDSCPGKSASLPFKCYRCKKAEHHAAVCPSLKNSKSSMNFQSNPGVMNPVLAFTVSRGKKKKKPNLYFCLIQELSLAL